MLDAVFISDLHLHPEEKQITARFNTFIEWAAVNTRTLYILGDFFHAWAGDDGLEPWSKLVAERLHWLSQQQVKIYYMHGNRDFLLGQQFAKAAGMEILAEPAIIKLGNDIMLVHGDRYCTKDRAHQWFRRLTRNRWFTQIFLHLPLHLRNGLVNKVRQHSQNNKNKRMEDMDVAVAPMLKHMQKHNINILIHGHTHKPGLRNYQYNKSIYSQYVLSDWDDSPQLLCYDKTNGFEFVRFVRGE
ncbi:UDP-2,3-diacylglucosamine diphosphatase [Legionella hackeliae]|uniref:UDP-2,3-diacylglucosamine hydrolase n=1 Tax=Legionella hackeliae TaxID=449 RepID=A0A0A8UU99_LEGHA|nr:UDP-2,3-diacylglucosamine diphosphatase [Legionella hackeliae]KTD13918.1 UDP-2,3-diacylglucosamine hydrolase [Legionella hackeliae]CEK10622.1 UDP-2,3-diacylglucosamine hydrolase [Legionella hackeliae]STX47364.1 UDP-2,3-diacylglucosamine hydrolase [Legionella hackeliae]